ncbi:hypothetical protein INN71_04660 [Nocardioides sp. ChNu-153]|uniref:maltokinase N-terminal cap-like domain-containing protein n=1 Tax=Nocardioides sp. ChNu-153 TaxID=2779364 RepID=UPI00264C3FB8|nr:hypothetical protein [Nocardioides sp. ChNu-153]MDN7120680.1 hypothetical protein [Nocardioides sp. ChNu-153]
MTDNSEHTPAERLTEHLAHARWFGGKGRPFHVSGVRRAGDLRGTGSDDDPFVAIEFVEVSYTDAEADAAAGAEGATELYQVPVACYRDRQERLDHAFVGWWEVPGLPPAADDPEGTEHGWAHVYDAAHDRVAMRAWLAAFERARDNAVDASSSLVFHRLPGHELDVTAKGSLFSGEQSNSSVMFGEDALMKIFRKVTPGVNPDVQVHDVLTRAGSDHVAALYGWLDVVDETSDAVIQLAMLQQFLRTASDGWDLAQASVRNLFAEADLHADEVGGDFAGESARLGVALAETHAVLADHFPVELRRGDDVRALADSMHRRLDAALEVVADLAPYADGLRARFDRVAELDEVPVQRVHGDLHLGQTLRTTRGWKIVDFEGEPAKPLHERLVPDTVWRDVAGMLRSFDYAPRVVARTLEAPDEAIAEQRGYRAEEWAAHNRRAFLSAYAGRDLTPEEDALLTAYVADKAVYETVYETRNRPGWVGIPLAAIARIGAR